jgi:hypothetical protein
VAVQSLPRRLPGAVRRLPRGRAEATRGPCRGYPGAYQWPCRGCPEATQGRAEAAQRLPRAVQRLRRAYPVAVQRLPSGRAEATQAPTSGRAEAAQRLPRAVQRLPRGRAGAARRLQAQLDGSCSEANQRIGHGLGQNSVLRILRRSQYNATGFRVICEKKQRFEAIRARELACTVVRCDCPRRCDKGVCCVECIVPTAFKDV